MKKTLPKYFQQSELHYRIESLIFYSTLVYGIIFLTFYDFIFPKLAIGGIMEILLLWICKKYILDINIKLKV